MTQQATEPAAVIFDLDGTLLDTEPLYTLATDRLLAPHGHRITPQLKRRMIGRSAGDSARILIEAFSLPFGVDEYLAAREEELRALFPKAEEVSGARRYVEYLAARGLPMGIATSSYSSLTRLKLAERPWRKLVSVVVNGDDPRLARAKPAPDIFLLCAAELGVAPEKCLAFEDSPSGVAAASAAGMSVIAVHSPWVRAEDIRAAKRTIRGFEELLPAE